MTTDAYLGGVSGEGAHAPACEVCRCLVDPRGGREHYQWHVDRGEAEPLPDPVGPPVYGPDGWPPRPDGDYPVGFYCAPGDPFPTDIRPGDVVIQRGPET